MAFIVAKTKSTPISDYKSLNVLIYGSPGVGKTTLASCIDIGGSAYVFDMEGSSKCLSNFNTLVNSFEDYKEGVEWACKQKDHQHIVIDTIDILYKLCEDYVCRLNKLPNMAAFPFGSGYSAMNKFLFDSFKKMNDAGLGITFISHEATKEMSADASGTIKWTTSATSLSDKFETKIAGLCDLVLFCYKDRDGKRFIRTESTKSHKCPKDRTGKLPPILPMEKDGKSLILALNKKQNV